MDGGSGCEMRRKDAQQRKRSLISLPEFSVPDGRTSSPVAAMLMAGKKVPSPHLRPEESFFAHLERGGGGAAALSSSAVPDATFLPSSEAHNKLDLTTAFRRHLEHSLVVRGREPKLHYACDSAPGEPFVTGDPYEPNRDYLSRGKHDGNNDFYRGKQFLRSIVEQYVATALEVAAHEAPFRGLGGEGDVEPLPLPASAGPPAGYSTWPSTPPFVRDYDSPAPVEARVNSNVPLSLSAQHSETAKPPKNCVSLEICASLPSRREESGTTIPRTLSSVFLDGVSTATSSGGAIARPTGLPPTPAASLRETFSLTAGGRLVSPPPTPVQVRKFTGLSTLVGPEASSIHLETASSMASPEVPRDCQTVFPYTPAAAASTATAATLTAPSNGLGPMQSADRCRSVNTTAAGPYHYPTWNHTSSLAPLYSAGAAGRSSTTGLPLLLPRSPPVNFAYDNGPPRRPMRDVPSPQYPVAVVLKEAPAFRDGWPQRDPYVGFADPHYGPAVQPAAWPLQQPRPPVTEAKLPLVFPHYCIGSPIPPARAFQAFSGEEPEMEEEFSEVTAAAAAAAAAVLATSGVGRTRRAATGGARPFYRSRAPLLPPWHNPSSVEATWSPNCTAATRPKHLAFPPHAGAVAATSYGGRSKGHGAPLIPTTVHAPLVAPAMHPAVVLHPSTVVQQPGHANASQALSPVASRSLLTCSRDFQNSFPNVYSGLCKGIVDVNRLIVNEIIIPLKEEITFHQKAIRSRRALIGCFAEQLWKPLHGRFPDPAIAPKLVRQVAEYFFGKIEAAVQQAEDERSALQWLLRLDVENVMEIRVTTTLGVGLNSVIANIEGTARLRRRKGDFFSLLKPDHIVVDMDLSIRALFLNGGALSEINNDPLFIDRVQASENRFAASFFRPAALC